MTNEYLSAIKEAANTWRGTDTYGTAAQFIDDLVAEVYAIRTQQEQAFDCTQFEECEYNGQPRCCLPGSEKCPHGVKRDKGRPGGNLDEKGGKPLVTKGSTLGENAPLTLEELRQMDGAPVWVVCDEAAVKTTPGFEPLTLWALVEVCEESIFLTNNLGGRTEYAADVELECDGITAYRRKPEKERRN